ncbi:hypothetical protein [Grimontia hollisae]|uniref:hypothetical protein n=1 Tax=Grimontia hollisae TaxID=673 RepID=UPI000DFF49B8|nr:hypothetical protein [Grimontia hollisae]STQ75540.1 Uncharacterised protein [Grimontia hollisae]
MFKIVKSRIVKHWPVKVVVPAEGGKTESFDIKLDVEVVDTETFNTLSRQGDGAFMARVVKGWSGVGDEAGNEVPFNDENLAAVSKDPLFGAAVMRAYLQLASGQAATKN